MDKVNILRAVCGNFERLHGFYAFLLFTVITPFLAL